MSPVQLLWVVLACAFLLRLITIGLYPLTDTTDARYGEIARKMLETGQWIVPQIDYGLPFWGKPPLSFWLTAVSYQLFGVNEFAARLPSLLLGLAICVLAYLLVAAQRDRETGLRAAVVVATSALMTVLAGSVMTDLAMALGTSLSMLAFWRALGTRSRVWGYLFFVGLAIGLLAKGPVAAVLTLVPVVAWALLTGRLRAFWSALPLMGGSLLVAFLVVPWYWAAELQSPGFLRYFLLGEHWQRFMVSGWRGDLYGTAHAYPRGTIWLYALAAGLPWAPWLLWRLGRNRRQLGLHALRADHGWLGYLLCWALTPVLFFTLAGNILPTYVLPGLLGFAALVAEAWSVRASELPRDRLALLGMVMPVAIATIALLAMPLTGFKSQKDIVAGHARLQARVPLVYIGRRPYSAEFYSRGRALEIDGGDTLRQRLIHPAVQYYAASARNFSRLPVDLRAQLTPVMQSRNGRYLLLRNDTDGRAAWIAGSGAACAQATVRCLPRLRPSVAAVADDRDPGRLLVASP